MKTLPLLTILVLLVGCGGPTKRCLVSPLSGTLVANGKPVEGAKVTRKYHSHWYKNQVEEVVRTDAKGQFEFEGAWKRAAVDVLHQPVVEEQVIVERDGTNCTVLDVTKMNYDDFGELQDVSQKDKSRLSKQEGRLCFKFDLDLDKVPIGRSQ
jgi:Domain of unknown function (DUF6795)